LIESRLLVVKITRCRRLVGDGHDPETQPVWVPAGRGRESVL
jgi:hypothetical protein